MIETKFHDSVDAGYTPGPLAGQLLEVQQKTTTVQRSLTYSFRSHFHPYVAKLVHELIEGSVRGLQAADTWYKRKNDGSYEMLPPAAPGAKPLPRPEFYAELFTTSRYAPSGLVTKPYPVNELDFSTSGAYSVYNWELFYHVPLTIAIHLSRNGRFEEAQRWLHYIFDPTDDSSGPTPERFWKVKPFQTTDAKMIEEILVNLSTGADPTLQQDTFHSINDWKAAPFRPHVVARHRQTAYMFKAVTAYLDNLIAWGDMLFRQDTGESINEATQLYVLCANILGPRPQEVPRKGWQRPQAYKDLRGDLDAFGNVLREVEADIPFDLAPHPTGPADEAKLATLKSLGAALYFCVPRNDRLIGYWDTVADRLFKIRNSLNIQGVFRQLPLFEPPIDPALLAKAAAAGLDVGAIVSGLNQPLPLVRFGLLVAKASELCQEVKSLDAALLSAIEKEDTEALAALRAQQEGVILGLAEVVKYQQWREAAKAREGVEKSLDNAVGRYAYYGKLLGKADKDLTAPALDALDIEALERMNYKQQEPAVPTEPIAIPIAQDTSGEGGGHKLIAEEVKELDKLSDARDKQETAGTFDKIGGALSIIPNFSVNLEPWGIGASVSFGGSNLAAAMTLTASFYRGDADELTYEAGTTGKVANFARREHEWAYQRNVAAGEITQTYKQLRAAQIREAIAERELANHRQQMKHAAQIEAFLTSEKTGKTSRQSLYTWLRREVRGLYGQCFQLAFDLARKAERALQRELGDPNASFLQFGYQGGKEGLLAGERLALDIKRMELAYHELNRREYELTRHVSLMQLDPRALLSLRATGSCTVTLPEELFDMDGPGHYFRRLKTVAVSIPCVVGPYASVNCTLTLLRSSVRTSPALGEDGYSRTGPEDGRFSDHFGPVESVVTSSGNDDSGLFEANLRDERLLPFEYAGAISQWRLDLPAAVPQFDHDTIADVIMHLRYTAREGGYPLRDAAVTNLEGQIAAAAAVGSVRLLSVRHEFPTEWARFTAVELSEDVPVAPLRLTLRPEHYPFWSTLFPPIGLTAVELFADPGPSTASTVTVFDKEVDEPEGTQIADELSGGAGFGDLLVGALSGPMPAAVGELTRYVDDNSMSDLWLALTWGRQGEE